MAATLRAMLLVVLLAPVAVHAQVGSKAPVALVVEVAGGRIPGVDAFREIAAGTKVNVPAGVRLVF